MIQFFKNVFGKDKGKAEEKSGERPLSGNVLVKGSVKNMKKLKSELSGLSLFSDISEDKGSIAALIVESTDRKKNPYLYIRMSFGKEGLEAFYSVTPEVPNPHLRRLEVMKTVFTLLSLLESKGAFIPDKEDLYAKVVDAFTIGANLADADSLKMKYELDRYTKENLALRGTLAKLKEEKEGLNHRLFELEKKCERLDARIRQLESLTDDELDREIVKWVEDHAGKLDQERFCSSFGLNGARLEERLDHLSKTGVVRIV